MYHNLTELQLKNLRWIIERIREGKLKESFVVTPVASGELIFHNAKSLETIPDYIDLGSFYALAEQKVILGGEENKYYIYTVTRLAYEIADFDINNPDPWPKLAYIKEVRRLLYPFSREDLSRVCFDLGMNPDWVFGEKLNWPHWLLVHLNKENKLKELTPILRENWPLIDWPDYPVEEF